MLLDIVILAPQSLRAKIARNMVKAAKGTDFLYLIDNRRLIPHLSLFHIRISQNTFGKLNVIIRKIASKYKSTKVKSLGLKSAREGEFWYNWFQLSNSTILKKLNKEIVSQCSILRSGNMPWGRKFPPTGLDKRLRDKYGTQYNIGKRFSPHFTMAKFKNRQSAEKAAKRIKFNNFEFIADTVAICEVNKFHQVIRIIKKFKLV